MLTDVATSGDRNVIKKEAEKILTYKDLTTEIQRMWNVKTKVIPVITGQQEPPQNHSQNTSATHLHSTHQVTTQNSHMWHCTSTDVNVQNVQHGE